MLFLTTCPVPVILVLACFQVANAGNWGVVMAGDGDDDNLNTAYLMNSGIVRSLLMVNGFPEDHIITVAPNDIPVIQFNGNELQSAGMISPSISAQDTGFNMLRDVLAGSPLLSIAGIPVVGSTENDNIFFYYCGPCSGKHIVVGGKKVMLDELREALFEGTKFARMHIVVDHPNSGRMLNALRIPARVYAIASVKHTSVILPRQMYEEPFTGLWAVYILALYTRPLNEIMAEISTVRDIPAGMYGDLAIGERPALDFLVYSRPVQQPLGAMAMP